MLYRKAITRITVAVLLSVFCFTAFLSIAVIAINLDGWYKSSDGGNYIQIDVSDVDFLVIKQANGAVIWTKQPLNVSGQAELISKLSGSGYDPSLASCTDGVVITSLTSFKLKDVLGFTGKGGKYDATVTVTEKNGILTLTINGNYSHYAYGHYADETTVTVTETTPPVTITETTPPATNETTATQTETTPPVIVITDPPPPLISETSYTEITTFEPPYTGTDFDMNIISVVIIAVLLFGSISGLAILLHILKKLNAK